MSCDFGPIPMPQSPMELYWEERLNHSARSSMSGSVAQPAKKDIGRQLSGALEKLEQDEGEDTEQHEALSTLRKVERNARPITHRRGQSLGQRLLSGGLEFLTGFGRETGPSSPGEKVSRSGNCFNSTSR